MDLSVCKVMPVSCVNFYIHFFWHVLTHSFVVSSYSICHVSVVGRPLSDFKAHFLGDQSKFWLEYIGRFKGNDTGGDGANKLLVPEGEVATGTWMSFAERIRQLRASRILRRNPILLNTFLGNITMANLLLDQGIPMTPLAKKKLTCRTQKWKLTTEKMLFCSGIGVQQAYMTAV